MRTSTISGASGVPTSRASWAVVMVSGVAMCVPSSLARYERRDASAEASRGDRGQPLTDKDGEAIKVCQRHRGSASSNIAGELMHRADPQIGGCLMMERLGTAPVGTG